MDTGVARGRKTTAPGAQGSPNNGPQGQGPPRAPWGRGRLMDEGVKSRAQPTAVVGYEMVELGIEWPPAAHQIHVSSPPLFFFFCILPECP